MPTLNDIKNVPASPEGLLGRLYRGTCSVHLSSLFGLRDLASLSEDYVGVSALHILASCRKDPPGPELQLASSPYTSAVPSLCDAAPLYSSIWIDCLIHLFIWQLFIVMPATADGVGIKAQTPCPYSGQLWRVIPASEVSEDLLSPLLWLHHNPSSPLPNPVSSCPASCLPHPHTGVCCLWALLS